ncbi:hypothetical protein JF536_11555 [Priestia flexa]|uniref:hypothetical protein n=1 Tax=Priestia flexa TaxID=86664 RepID=UPI001A8C7A9C|nr:hypothetical protein [Priestia flexa]MBN8434732.1 hypothetical protein [Priestia flexa]MCA0967270.1 hypothetical protein [Priestia flexa]
MFDFDVPGLSGRFTEDGSYNYLFKPNELPYEQGFVIWEQKGEFKKEIQDKVGFSCFVMVHLRGNRSLSSPINAPLKHGDTDILLEEDTTINIEMFGTLFSVKLIKNASNYLGNLEIRTENVNWDFEQTKENLFQVMNQVINRLAFNFGVPISAASFVINYKILNMFSVIEAQPKVKEYTHKDFFALSSRKFDLAMGHYNKSVLSLDPQTKFLWLYIANETIRSVIKEMLDIDESQRNIRHSWYKEPRFSSDSKKDPVLKIVSGQLYGTVLYKTLRELRNASAHHILDNGEYKDISTLKDYIEFYQGVTILNEVFQGYLKKVKYINKKKVANSQ